MKEINSGSKGEQNDEKFDPLDGREIVYKDLKTIHT